MTEQMSRPDITSDQRRKMAHRMELMSGMMRRMSGFEVMPAMMAPEQQRQMDEMRKQMDEMMESSSMKPGLK
jgi:polyhydroxyalkanoate synthesis regulator protein